tara:strand:- start:624 stop:725 length:102 start_codon:yes stop_codon:yes gene_type:complete
MENKDNDNYEEVVDPLTGVKTYIPKEVNPDSKD